MKKIILLACLISSSAFADAAPEPPQNPEYQITAIDHTEANGDYNGKKDIAVFTLATNDKVVFDSGYSNISLMTSVMLPGNEKIFAAGVQGGTGDLWLAQYDLKQKKMISKYDALLKTAGLSGFPVNLYWNAGKNLIEITVEASEGRLLITIDPAKNKILEKAPAPQITP